MSNTEIVVVGAGVAGLSAALAVAGTGHDVTLVTKVLAHDSLVFRSTRRRVVLPYHSSSVKDMSAPLPIRSVEIVAAVPKLAVSVIYLYDSFLSSTTIPSFTPKLFEA